MRNFLILFFLLALGMALLGNDARAQNETDARAPLYRSNAFMVTDTSVQQGQYEAVARSREEMASTYPLAGQKVNFKLSIGGRPNERPSGSDHRVYLQPTEGGFTTPVYTFGQDDPPEATPEGPPPARPVPEGDTLGVTFRVDMRPVLDSLREKGHYTTFNGERITSLDEGVYIVGDTDPLTWDFAGAAEQERFRLTDPDGDGIFTVALPFPRQDARALGEDGNFVWAPQEDLSDFPQYASGQRLVDALYRLSLEEVLQNIRAEDGAFMAGAKWTGVWTRDISYSILLALALVDPESAKTSLRAKVDSLGRVIQDTGTGGSWPVSSDRMTWALAAWEVYLVTGEDEWLREAYDALSRSAEADLQTVRDSETGLFYGESSFLDWREQSYPRWMDPKDIYLSQALGTNAVHYGTYRILEQMAEALGEPSARWSEVAEGVKAGMNAYLWQPGRGFYGQFRYGRNAAALSPRAEALGNALAVLLGVANPEQAEQIAARFPLVAYGVPTLYPQTPGIPPYHNDSIWPFVVAYWTWAAAEAQNAAAVEHGLASLYRAAALFLTNKENMVASTGHFAGTEINSDRQLWSVAGTLASVYRVFFGMRFEEDRLVFEPFVPEAYGGERTLTGLPWRGATLDVTVRGFGNEIESATLDGEALDTAAVPADLTGRHQLVITLNDGLPPSAIHAVDNLYAPATPDVRLSSNALQWDAVPDAVGYEVYRNGQPVAMTEEARFPVEAGEKLAEYQVQALGASGWPSFLSAPVRVGDESAVRIVQAEAASAAEAEQEHEGYTGEGYLRLTKEENTTVEIPVEVEEAGAYAIAVRYANGSGPVNTDNKAALRRLRVDGRRVGPIVMPQRGDGQWNLWGYSNPQRVRLGAGRHTFTLTLTPSDENMNLEVNTALLDHIRLTRLPE